MPKDSKGRTVGQCRTYITHVCVLECFFVCFFLRLCQLFFCVMYDIQQTALFRNIINIQCKDTLQTLCGSFGFLRTEVANSRGLQISLIHFAHHPV